MARYISAHITHRFNPENQSGILYFHRVLDEKTAFSRAYYPDDPDAKELDELIGLLKQAFNIVSLTSIVAGEKFEKPSVALTFDDGFKDNFTVARHILKKHDIPATFFIATEGMITGNLWQDKVVSFFDQAPASVFDDLFLPFQGKLSHRAANCHHYMCDMKFMEAEKRQAVIDELFSYYTPKLSREMMTANQIASLSNDGHEIGAHTVGHEILTTCSYSQAQREIKQSKSDLESVLGKRVDLFCYPNGLPKRDFTDTHKEMVKGAGFVAGFSTQDGGISKETDLFSLPRFLPFRRYPLVRAISTAKIIGEKV